MAAQSPWKRLQEETTCSVCLDLFTQPVSLECGHSFCEDCISQRWLAAPQICPQCGETVQPDRKANRQLASFVEIVRQFSEQEKGDAGVCQAHRKPLNLFCKDDRVLLCGDGVARAHRGHAVVPAEEAAQDCQEELCRHLDILRKERKKILACTSNTKQESQDLIEVTRSERDKTFSEFRKMHRFLEEQEQFLLGQMEKLKKEIEKERDERLARLSEELSTLESFIQEMEEKNQQPVRAFLEDIGSTLERCEEKENFENPGAFPTELKWRNWDFSDLNSFLEGVRKQFKDLLESGLQQQEANVTLDPDTAHPQLTVAKDRKSVGWGSMYQDLPDNPERFDKHCMVLGCEQFSSGRHCWEVTVGSVGGWAVGVARTSMKRKGKFACGPKGGIWAIKTWKGAYKAFIPCLSSPLAFSGVLRRIRVCLNCAGGQVAFFDAETAAPLYTFPGISFPGETFQPFFRVYKKGFLAISP